MVKTRINYISDSWTRIKNHCRTTVNKEFSEKYPSDTFKERLLIAEHSPIRCLEVDWSWEHIKYWVSTEMSRHKYEKFISTQRDDRTNSDISRDNAAQGTPVNYDGYANSQNLIDMERKRLCYQATDEARECAESLKTELKKYEPELSSVLVPNCIYRGGCPEMQMCKNVFWIKFLDYCSKNSLPLDTIKQRYDAYNKMFYEERG